MARRAILPSAPGEATRPRRSVLVAARPAGVGECGAASSTHPPRGGIAMGLPQVLLALAVVSLLTAEPAPSADQPIDGVRLSLIRTSTREKLVFGTLLPGLACLPTGVCGAP